MNSLKGVGKLKNIYLKTGLYKIRVRNEDLTITKGTRNVSKDIAIKRGFLKRLSK